MTYRVEITGIAELLSNPIFVDADSQTERQLSLGFGSRRISTPIAEA